MIKFLLIIVTIALALSLLVHFRFPLADFLKRYAIKMAIFGFLVVYGIRYISNSMDALNLPNQCENLYGSLHGGTIAKSMLGRRIAGKNSVAIVYPARDNNSVNAFVCLYDLKGNFINHSELDENGIDKYLEDSISLFNPLALSDD